MSPAAGAAAASSSSSASRSSSSATAGSFSGRFRSDEFDSLHDRPDSWPETLSSTAPASSDALFPLLLEPFHF
ncbi:Os08g0510750 [Oryza sativa Japonica Group]|uniref:Os08g0510750 protein n=1 Tax=Oryza sativa subsp. japonica TaxID=39947 RepID=A0A0P0XHW4_ORYSJ|nr:hypothetical protein EE612_045294 [Oryza sativa]BAT06195.1 Os08g0510750 [Oryza sativa Japonica Group]